MNNYRNILLAIAVATVTSMAAQKESLTKEITVEKDYVPTEEKANKLNNLPEVSKVTTQKKSLDYSDWTAPTTINPFIPTMLPIGHDTTHKFSTKRGYFDFGMGSFLNMTGSAGYKILDSNVNSLNVWIQHNSSWTGKNSTKYIDDYNKAVDMINTPNEHLVPLKQKFNDNIIGVDFFHSFGNIVAGVNAFYHYDHFNRYGNSRESKKDIWQTVNEFNIALSLKNIQKDSGIKYFAGLSYDHFGNNGHIKENDFKLNGGVSMQSGEKSRIGIDLIADYLYYTNPYGVNDEQPYSVSYVGNNSYSLISLSPYYQLYGDKANLRFGVNFDLSISDGTILRFSPNVKFDYKFINGFMFYADVNGGKKLNTFSKLSTINRYFNPSMVLGSSYSPLDAVAGFKVGPFAGFTAKVWGGYAIVNNQQLPWINSDVFDVAGGLLPHNYTPYFDVTSYRGENMSGWQVGGEIAYKYKNIAELSARIAYSPQNENKGYVFSEDRPEYIIGAQLKVTPIEKLCITANYELRGNRAMWSRSEYGQAPVTISYMKSELGNVNLLNLGAEYRINDMFGVFAQFNNILNKQWDNYFFMGSQKFNALGGISILF
ncbi:MAG: hypothetical protein RSA66_04675 [Muribaculaceae bacterium]